MTWLSCPSAPAPNRPTTPASAIWPSSTPNPPTSVSAEEFRQYCIHLKSVKKVARQTSTQVICAFKLFWEKTLHRLWPAELQLVRANPQFKLPVVLSAAETRRILATSPPWIIASA